MRKAKLLAGLYGVYVVYDKISKHYIQMYFASTDEDFIRTKLPVVILDVALRDVAIYKIGIFNDVTGEIKPVIKKRINTDCYLFPHSKLSPAGENVSLEDIETTVKTTKNEIIASMSQSETENKEE